MNATDMNVPRRPNTDDPEISVNGVSLSGDARAGLYYLLFVGPLLFLLILRFLFSNIIRIIFLATLFLIQYRICNCFNEQVALKGASSKKAFWVLFWSASGTLLLVSILTPPVFKMVLWPRYVFMPFENPDVDFLGVIWITCLTDLAFKIGLTALKSVACALLPTYSTQPDSYTICSGDISLMSLFRIGPGLRMWFLNFQRSVEARISELSSRPFRRSDHPVVNGEDHLPHTTQDDDIEFGLLASGNGSVSSVSHSQSSGLFSLVNRRRSSANGSGSSTSSRGDSADEVDLSTSSTPSTHTYHHDEDTQSRDSLYKEMSIFLRLKRVLNIVDMISLCVRSMLPVLVWLCYFKHGPGSDFISTAYICLKWLYLCHYVRLSAQMIKDIKSGATEHGSYSSEADIARTGTNSCSICFDPYIHPVTLSPCKHVFCEHCIYVWLEKEDTCPVCRALVKEKSGEDYMIQKSAMSDIPVVM